MENKMQLAMESFCKELFRSIIESHEAEMAELRRTAPQMLTRREAMKYLLVSATTLRQLELDGKLTATRVGRKVLFKKVDLDNFINNNYN